MDRSYDNNYSSNIILLHNDINFLWDTWLDKFHLIMKISSYPSDFTTSTIVLLLLFVFCLISYSHYKARVLIPEVIITLNNCNIRVCSSLYLSWVLLTSANELNIMYIYLRHAGVHMIIIYYYYYYCAISLLEVARHNTYQLLITTAPPCVFHKIHLHPFVYSYYVQLQVIFRLTPS